MKCPACSAPLSELRAGEVAVDVCATACGGAWFDPHELDKLDEVNEAVPAQVLRPVKNAQVVIDYNKKRECPRCTGKTLEKKLHDEHYQLEIDECGGCGGIWLDLGELDNLRNDNKSQDERNRVISGFERAYGGSDEAVPGKRVKAVLRLLFR